MEQVLSSLSYKLNTPGRRGAVTHHNHLKHYVRSVSVNHVVLADGELDNTGQLELPGLPTREDIQIALEAKEVLNSLTDQEQRGHS